MEKNRISELDLKTQVKKVGKFSVVCRWNEIVYNLEKVTITEAVKIFQERYNFSPTEFFLNIPPTHADSNTKSTIEFCFRRKSPSKKKKTRAKLVSRKTKKKRRKNKQREKFDDPYSSWTKRNPSLSKLRETEYELHQLEQKYTNLKFSSLKDDDLEVQLTEIKNRINSVLGAI